jgi:hypothetical protein
MRTRRTIHPDIVALLREPSLWQEPSDGLRIIVADIAEERRVVADRATPRVWPGGRRRCDRAAAAVAPF